MIIPIHSEEEIPMMNCWEWKVFAKYWANARTCMTKEEYEVKQDIENHNFLSALWLSIVIVLLWVWAFYLFNRD